MNSVIFLCEPAISAKDVQKDCMYALASVHVWFAELKESRFGQKQWIRLTNLFQGSL